MSEVIASENWLDAGKNPVIIVPCWIYSKSKGLKFALHTAELLPDTIRWLPVQLPSLPVIETELDKVVKKFFASTDLYMGRESCFRLGFDRAINVLSEFPTTMDAVKILKNFKGEG